MSANLGTGTAKVAVFMGSASRTTEVGLINGLKVVHGPENVKPLRTLEEAIDFFAQNSVDMVVTVFDGDPNSRHTGNIHELFDLRGKGRGRSRPKRLKHQKVLYLLGDELMSALENEQFDHDHIAFLPNNIHDEEEFANCARIVMPPTASAPIIH